jgi:hypothetical protein
MTDVGEIRQRYFAKRKVICTGNPNKQGTIASAIKTLFPDTVFLHLSNGWDLTDRNLDDKLMDVFAKHNTFINASYIAPDVQNRLLELCKNSVKFCDVFNIGSTHEYDGLGTEEYKQSKLLLRENSLILNTFRFKTHHIIVGKLSHRDISVEQIADLIYWIMQQKFEVPIIAIDQSKQSW